MGLFYLLTLYGLVRGAENDLPGDATRDAKMGTVHSEPLRGAESKRGVFWYSVSAAACLFGMASKEVMVTAPFIALLYDRTFLAGSFREALRRRWGLYLAFAVALALMENLAYHAGKRGSSAGFGLRVLPLVVFAHAMPGHRPLSPAVRVASTAGA